MPTDSPPPSAAFDLRLAWCFTVVAEHRHFGRAAEALHTSQPSLSRQIHRLEQQLGARLFERTPHGNFLTPAGEAFLPLATALLRSADQAVAHTRAAARPSRVTIGYTAGIIVTPAVRELRHRRPGAEVHTLHLAAHEPHAALLDRRVDAVVARLPFPTDGLSVTALYDEPRVLVVPVAHRLAGKESVTLDDIVGEPIPKVRGMDTLTSAFWRIDPRPDGRPAPDGPVVEGVVDKLELVAAGQAVTISARAQAHQLRPDLTTVPLEGVEPSHVVLATRNRDRNALVAAFRACARNHLTDPGPLSAEVIPHAHGGQVQDVSTWMGPCRELGDTRGVSPSAKQALDLRFRATAHWDHGQAAAGGGLSDDPGGPATVADLAPTACPGGHPAVPCHRSGASRRAFRPGPRAPNRPSTLE